jgi:YgiT-type zinc finger domain-containing protein
MIGKSENSGRCPLCGGRLMMDQRATIPFILGQVVVVVKDVPAEVCRNCREPYLTGTVTDQLLEVLKRFARLPVEVSVASYPELMAAKSVVA